MQEGISLLKNEWGLCMRHYSTVKCEPMGLSKAWSPFGAWMSFDIFFGPPVPYLVPGFDGQIKPCTEKGSVEKTKWLFKPTVLVFYQYCKVPCICACAYRKFGERLFALYSRCAYTELYRKSKVHSLLAQEKDEWFYIGGEFLFRRKPDITEST